MIKMQAIPGPIVIPESTIGLQDARVIPFEITSRLVPRSQTVSIVELGKNLLRAARHGNTDQVRELMSKGAPFTTDWLGTSPLHYAALNNHLETCEILLRAGISRDARTKVDRTPLHMAAYAGHLSIVEVLVVNGAEVDSLDMLKMTPLHWAVQNEYPEVVTFLLRHGANPHAINKFDKTPCNIAADTSRLDILQLLQIVTKDPVTPDEDQDLEVLESAHEKTAEYFAEEGEAHAEPCKMSCQVADDEDDDDVIRVKNSPEESVANDMPDSMQILKEHGISFLPADTTTSVVASAVENGHSLVLTEVGKQVLNSTKHLTKVPIPKATVNKMKPQKLIAVTPEQLLAMTSSPKGIFRKVSMNTLTGKPIRRLVMNKNRYTVSGVPHIIKRQTGEATTTSIEYLKKQLAEAKRQAEEYKTKSEQKKAEAERYERQLKSMTQGK